MIKTVEWTAEGVVMIDQRLLPTEEKYLTLRSCEEVAEAIKAMVVRGAPAIGISAAMGIALGTMQAVGTNVEDLEQDFDHFCEVMSATRPTAVNLFWAIERMRDRFRRAKAAGADAESIKRQLIEEAQTIFKEDIEANRALGRFGGELIPDGATVLTHCNAGALATAGDYGTALGVVRGARDAGKRVAVIADETRPFLQGARLTAWELAKDEIPVTIITDNMAGHVMKQGKVDAVVVGADRIAANGDAANKIGTYMVAVLARAPRHPLLRRRARLDRRPRAPHRRPDPHRGARRARSHARPRPAPRPRRRPRPQPRLRRDAPRTHRRHHHRQRRRPPALHRELEEDGRGLERLGG